MEIQLLKDIVIIFGLSIVVIFICHRIRVPAIVEFLLTRILAGPYGLELVRAVHEVEILAEVGIVLLLFTVGIEFSLKNLLQIKKSAVGRVAIPPKVGRATRHRSGLYDRHARHRRA